MKLFRSIYIRVGAVGLALIIIGLLLGADTTYYWDFKGLHSAKALAGTQSQASGELASLTDMGMDNAHRKVLQGDLMPYTRLDINVGSASVEIIPSDRWSLEIASRDLANISYTNQGGVCKIKQETLFSWKVFSFSFWEESDHIKISIPRGTALSSISLAIGSGRLSAQQVHSETFALDLTSGNADLKNITAGDLQLHCASGDIRMADVAAQALGINIQSGRLDGLGLQSQSASLHLSSGSASLAGELLGSTELRIMSGTLTMSMAGKREDYSVVSSVASGSIWVDGQINPSSTTDAQALHSLDVSIASGMAKINFAPSY